MTVSMRLFGLALAALALVGCAAPRLPAATPAPTPRVFEISTGAPPTPAPPTPTPRVFETPTVSTQTPAASATATLFIRQLTTGACCSQPFWSADGSQVRYVDRPSSGQPSGIWGVSLLGGAPVFVTSRLGIYSPDEKLVAYPEGGQTYIERVGGERWRVGVGGRAISFSPDGARIAWQTASSLFNFDSRHVEIWIAGVDGAGARKVAELVGGGLAGWFPDGRRLLVTSRDGDATHVQALNIADGGLTPIASAPRLQGLALSPAGGWLAYVIAFSGDASLDGLWVVRADGQGARRLDVFGGFAWRGEGRLLVVPLEPASPSNRLLEADAATGALRTLTDPAVTPFQIAQGNWSLSPDGAHLAFASAADHNIWIIDLTE